MGHNCKSESGKIRPAFAEPIDKLRVSKILRSHASKLFSKYNPGFGKGKVYSAILKCRTEELGGHLCSCPACNFQQVKYNSCRNKHCPTCYSLSANKIRYKRSKAVLRVPHDSLTFKIPTAVRSIARQSPKEFYKLFFNSCSKAILKWAKEVHHCRPGVSTVLHTSTKELLFQPHNHTLTTCGGLSLDGEEWKSFSIGEADRLKIQDYYYDKMIHGLYSYYKREKFAFCKDRDGLGDKDTFKTLMLKAKMSTWDVYVSKHNGNVDDVIEKQWPYLLKPTISDSRLLSYENDLVSFTTRNGQRTTITSEQFVHRFDSHILPKRFNRIRHAGLYSSYDSNTRLVKSRELIEQLDNPPEPQSSLWDCDTFADFLKELGWPDPTQCPVCGFIPMKMEELVQDESQGICHQAGKT